MKRDVDAIVTARIMDASPRLMRRLEAGRSPSRTVEGMARRGVEPTRLRRAVLKSQIARAALACVAADWSRISSMSSRPFSAGCRARISTDSLRLSRVSNSVIRFSYKSSRSLTLP